jgi:hypothetical protein
MMLLMLLPTAFGAFDITGNRSLARSALPNAPVRQDRRRRK